MRSKQVCHLKAAHVLVLVLPLLESPHVSFCLGLCTLLSLHPMKVLVMKKSGCCLALEAPSRISAGSRRDLLHRDDWDTGFLIFYQQNNGANEARFHVERQWSLVMILGLASLLVFPRKKHANHSYLKVFVPEAVRSLASGCLLSSLLFRRSLIIERDYFCKIKTMKSFEHTSETFGRIATGESNWIHKLYIQDALPTWPRLPHVSFAGNLKRFPGVVLAKRMVK